MKLTKQLVIEIIEATGRFEYVNDDYGVFIFFDKHWEDEYHINVDITLKELIKWIYDFTATDYREQGKRDCQNEVKKALGFN